MLVLTVPTTIPIPPLPFSVSAVPEAMVVSGLFQGASANAETPRPSLNLDFPRWNAQTMLEDLEITCQRPATVSAFSTRYGSSAATFFNWDNGIHHITILFTRTRVAVLC